MLGDGARDAEARRRRPLRRQGLTPTAGPAAPTRCWYCARAIDADDRYCRACGEGQGAALAWYYKPIWIALLAATALGPFAIILIWRTPALGRTAKWIAALLLVALTVWVAWQLSVTVQTILDV